MIRKPTCSTSALPTGRAKARRCIRASSFISMPRTVSSKSRCYPPARGLLLAHSTGSHCLLQQNKSRKSTLRLNASHVSRRDLGDDPEYRTDVRETMISTASSTSDAELFDHPAHGPLHWFREWPNAEVPPFGARVYTVWGRCGYADLRRDVWSHYHYRHAAAHEALRSLYPARQPRRRERRSVLCEIPAGVSGQGNTWPVLVARGKGSPLADNHHYLHTR